MNQKQRLIRHKTNEPRARVTKDLVNNLHQLDAEQKSNVTFLKPGFSDSMYWNVVGCKGLCWYSRKCCLMRCRAI